MLTEFPDILHSVIHIDCKCITRQKITKVSQITELEQGLYKKSCALIYKKTVKLIYFDHVFAIRVYY